MTASKANYQRVLSSLSTEREEMLEQFRHIGYMDVAGCAVRRGAPPISEKRKLSFYDRRDRIQLNDF